MPEPCGRGRSSSACRSWQRQSAGETTGVEQSDTGITYAHKIEADDRRLDWAGTATDAANLVRALSPHIGARCEVDGEACDGVAGPFGSGRRRPGGDRTAARIACAEGVLEVLEVQPAGRRRMAVADYLRGLRQAPERAA